MSRWLERKGSLYLEEIESMEICKWKINEICCCDQCEYLGDYPYPRCKCESRADCKWFEKEDGILNGNK